MTRMEKWQSYRDEIARQANISNEIKSDNSNLEKYKSEIDKINPAILSSPSLETFTLERGVSKVDIQQTGISTEIADMFKNINSAANVINQDNVEDIFANSENKTIVENIPNSNEKKFKQECFDNHKDYQMFLESSKGLEISNQKVDEQLTKELEIKFNKFNSKTDDQQIDRVFLIAKNSEKKSSHYFFVISISVSFFLLVVVLGLFIARLVTK